MTLWIDSNNQLHDDMDGMTLSLPTWPQGMIKATAAQIAAAQAPKPVPLPQQAQAALDKVTGPSGQIMRCMAAGVAVPAAWSAYVLALRNIVNGTDKTSTTLPTQPIYVSGT